MNQMWGKMPGWAQFLAIFMSAVMLTLGVSNREALLSAVVDSNKEGVEPVVVENVDIEFLIYSKDSNDPIDKAEVQFIFDGAPAPRLTNSDGYVRVEIPKRNDIDVVIKKDGFSDINRTINLLADPNRTITYFLETDESFSSYNLRGQSIPDGTRLGMSIITEEAYKVVDGNSVNSNLDEPFITLELIEKFNEEVEFEITEVEGNEPIQVLEKVEKNRTSLTGNMRWVAKDQNKSYEYEKSLSEVGAFEGSKISSAKSDGSWFGEIVEGRPTREQKYLLEEPFDIFAGISYDYPPQRLKVGQSWDFNDDFAGTDVTIIDSDVVATLSETTNYEGEEVALITVEGTAHATDISLYEPSQKDDSQDSKSMHSQIIDSLSKSLWKDFFLDYGIPALTQQISQDLYYDKFTLSDDLKNSSPEAYEMLIEIYQEVSNEERFDSYTLPTIEARIEKKINEKSIPNLLADSTTSWLFNEDLTVESDIINDSKRDIYDMSVNGVIYRSLRYPIDLLVDMNVSKVIETSGRKVNVESTYKTKLSVL